MNFLEKAIRVSDWIVSNQYEGHPDWKAKPEGRFGVIVEDMNYGRFVRNYVIAEEKVTHLSTNWLTGMAIFGLLISRELTGDDRYLTSALKASHYLKALQQTMSPDPRYRGPFSERATCNSWCAPRDALSAAWGLLRLYRATDNAEFLARTELFAEWHKTYVMAEGFPCGYYFFDGTPPDMTLASCQGGSALYYYDLYRVTGKAPYRDAMLMIADYYARHFVNADGSVNIYFDPKTGKGDPGDTAWADMHKYNDDFSALSILAAYKITGDKRYLDTVTRYMNWVITRQNPNDGFGEYSLSVSSCVVALNCLNLYLITGDEALLSCGKRALNHLETSMIDKPEDRRVHGGLLGLDVCDIPKSPTLCLRTSMYAIYTFALYHIYEELLNEKSRRFCALADNPMFIGLAFANGTGDLR